MRLASNILFAATLIASTALAGGVHTSVAALVCALGLTAFVTRWFHLRDREQRGIYLSLPVLGLTLLTFASFFQIVPLPELMQQLANPTGYDLAAAGLAAIGHTDVGWRTLSLDPYATSDRVIRFAALALVGLTAANFRERLAWMFVGRSLIGVGVIAAAVGSVLDVTGRKSLFGLFETEVGFRGPGPFVSLNHGATFFGLCVIACVGLALTGDRKRVFESAGYWLAALVFGVLAVLHDSDGVLLALGATAAAAGFVAWWRMGRPTALRRETAIGLVAIGLVSVALAAWLDVLTLVQDFFQRLFFEGEHGTRYELLKAGTAMAGDYWRFGGGAGSVETVIGAYIDWPAVPVPASIPVLENDTLELLYGFGMFVGTSAMLLMVSVVFFALRYAFVRERSIRYAVLIPTVLYLVLVAQLHFPLLALGIAVPAIAWVEALMARRSHVVDGEAPHATGHLAIPSKAGLGFAVVVATLACIATIAHYRSFGEALPQKLAAEEAVPFIKERPADHRIYVRVATRAAKDGRAKDAVRLAEHAVALNDSDRVRLFLARAVANAGDDDRAITLYDELLAEGHKPILAILADFRDPAVRAKIFARYPDLWSQVATTAVRYEGGSAGAEFALALVEAHPSDPRAYQVATEIYLGIKQPLLARMWAELLVQREVAAGGDTRGVVLLARAMIAAGDRAEARALIEETLNDAQAAVDPSLHRLALTLIPAVGDSTDEDIRFVTTHYEALCQSPIPAKELRLCWNTEAWLAEARGDLSGAEDVLERIRRKFDDPFPLAYLLLRERKCHDLDRLTSLVEPESPQQKRLSDLSSRCLASAPQ